MTKNLTSMECKCVDCGEKKHLVIVRMSASRCEKCYKNCLEKRRVLRELNKIAGGMLV